MNMPSPAQSFQQFHPYRHHKGGLYLKLCEARHADTDEVLVVYACAASGDVFCRPKADFDGLADSGQPRFAAVAYVTEKPARLALTKGAA